MAVLRKTVKLDAGMSCVSCPTCACEIAVQSALRLPREFSVKCPNCGWRREYQSAELHDAKPKAEPPREFPRIQFGNKNVQKFETENIFIQPETRLKQLASWLLQ
jgi:hypothetical protein